MKKVIRLTESQFYNLIETATKRIIESDEFNYYDDARGAREYAKAIKMPPGYDKGFNRDVNAGRNSREAERLLNLNGGDFYGSKEMRRAQKKYDNAELDNEISDFESKSSPKDYEDSDDFMKMRNKSDDWYGSLEKINDDNWNKATANESKKGKKQAIRLTESQFYNLIEGTIKKVMEGDEYDTISIDEEKITFDGDEDDDEVTFKPIKRFQKGPRKMKKD